MAEPTIIPIERSPVPVGTVEEAEREGLDPAAYATCARPNKAGGIVGCEWFHKCRVSAKGQSGPRNYGVEIVKGRDVGGGFVRTPATCMWIADHLDTIEKNGGALKVIANEGEELEIVTSVAVNAATGKETHQKDPMAERRKVRKKIVVNPFPRPGENVALLTDVLRAEAIDAEKERRTDEATARAYGLEHTLPPVDKRASGPDGGRKASGGGGSKG